MSLPLQKSDNLIGLMKLWTAKPLIQTFSPPMVGQYSRLGQDIGLAILHSSHPNHAVSQNFGYLKLAQQEHN